ncbi:hypothetical protein LY90DRAFT_629332 [Neocallimastix californiae]|uniref:Uncharacterized protein n=1 Tax=Neocallimastix californiae TaxID=1754190 RepID=A0A1Y2AV07_9FUNG|nr:hypothetical protein LY90DRAFT_629332 [Neocallimastix californiae]|eukprot:ORY26382.1 hypothetical protein LY90DRAFT_629332 [Neocallimastix californiae]
MGKINNSNSKTNLSKKRKVGEEKNNSSKDEDKKRKINKKNVITFETYIKTQKNDFRVCAKEIKIYPVKEYVCYNKSFFISLATNHNEGLFRFSLTKKDYRFYYYISKDDRIQERGVSKEILKRFKPFDCIKIENVKNKNSDRTIGIEVKCIFDIEKLKSHCDDTHAKSTSLTLPSNSEENYRDFIDYYNNSINSRCVDEKTYFYVFLEFKVLKPFRGSMIDLFLILLTLELWMIIILIILFKKKRKKKKKQKMGKNYNINNNTNGFNHFNNNNSLQPFNPNNTNNTLPMITNSSLISTASSYPFISPDLFTPNHSPILGLSNSLPITLSMNSELINPSLVTTTTGLTQSTAMDPSLLTVFEDPSSHSININNPIMTNPYHNNISVDFRSIETSLNREDTINLNPNINTNLSIPLELSTTIVHSPTSSILSLTTTQPSTQPSTFNPLTMTYPLLQQEQYPQQYPQQQYLQQQYLPQQYLQQPQCQQSQYQQPPLTPPLHSNQYQQINHPILSLASHPPLHQNQYQQQPQILSSNTSYPSANRTSEITNPPLEYNPVLPSPESTPESFSINPISNNRTYDIEGISKNTMDYLISSSSFNTSSSTSPKDSKVNFISEIGINAGKIQSSIVKSSNRKPKELTLNEQYSKNLHFEIRSINNIDRLRNQLSQSHPHPHPHLLHSNNNYNNHNGNGSGYYDGHIDGKEEGSEDSSSEGNDILISYYYITTKAEKKNSRSRGTTNEKNKKNKSKSLENEDKDEDKKEEDDDDDDDNEEEEEEEEEKEEKVDHISLIKHIFEGGSKENFVHSCPYIIGDNTELLYNSKRGRTNNNYFFVITKGTEILFISELIYIRTYRRSNEKNEKDKKGKEEEERRRVCHQ